VHRRRPGHRPAARTLVAAGVVAAAALSLLAPSQPGYDPWAWLAWGRELLALDLSTVEGPAFKPLPVAVAALLAPFGAAAPALWLVVARAGAIAAVVLAARLAWWLTGGSAFAAVAGGAGVALSAGWWWHAAVGNAEGLFLALALGALLCGLDGRHRVALGLAAAAALVRPESWPFLGAYALWLWRREPAVRPLAAAALAAVPALWLLPELLGSGDLLRSSARARLPNPGAPALAERPALASLEAAAAIPLLPLALAAPLARPRAALALGAAGLAWVLLVAVMAERGYSGEPRYALPGAAALAICGAVAVARAWRLRWLVVAVLVPFAVARVDGIAGELGRAADDAALFGSLDDAITAAGGREAVLACSPPVTGRYRGTAVAYALRVRKRAVGFDPARGGALLRSRVRAGASVQPAAPASGAPVLGRSARWEIRCAARR